MNADLAKLLDLQTRDEALKALDERLGEVAGDEQALDARLAEARRALDGAERAVQDATRRRDELAGRVAGYRRAQTQREQRLELVHKQKEFAAVNAEIDLARGVLIKEEGELARVDAELAAAMERRAAAEAALAELRAAQAGERDALAERRRALDEERRAAAQAREESAAQLDKPLRTRYDRLRKLRGTNVVVAMRNAACGACHTAIPTSRRTQVRGGLLLEGCEVCGVILYSGEAAG
jgi:hypothetical protein